MSKETQTAFENLIVNLITLALVVLAYLAVSHLAVQKQIIRNYPHVIIAEAIASATQPDVCHGQLVVGNSRFTLKEQPRNDTYILTKDSNDNTHILFSVNSNCK